MGQLMLDQAKERACLCGWGLVNANERKWPRTEHRRPSNDRYACAALADSSSPMLLGGSVLLLYVP